MTTEVLIVGANGFLGSMVTKLCLEEGWVADAVINIGKSNIPDGVREIIGVKDLEEKALNKNYKFIFNTAAFIPYGAYNMPNEQLLNSNILLALEIHRLFQNSKIIFASSVSVYGDNYSIIKENSEYINPTMYGLSKLSGELITSHHGSFSIIRFSSLYGESMYPGTFIPRIINDAKLKNKILLLGNGARKQNYLYIKDAAKYCINAALYGMNEVYLGVNNGEIQNSDVAEIVASYFSGCEIEYNGEDNSPSFIYNNRYTNELLKFTPNTDLQVGIKDLINE